MAIGNRLPTVRTYFAETVRPEVLYRRSWHPVNNVGQPAIGRLNPHVTFIQTPHEHPVQICAI